MSQEVAPTSPAPAPVEGRARAAMELLLVFLRLGTTAFGGPAAHIAMMEREFVSRRAWLSRDQFLDLVGAASLIPGPSSTQVAIYVGYRRGGLRGLLLAGVGFILPAALLVTAIAWAYVRYGALPAAGGALYGIKAVIIAILGQALVAFARTAMKTRPLMALAGLAAMVSALGASPVLVLLAAGLASALIRTMAQRPGAPLAPLGALVGSTLLSGTPTAAKLSFVFLKIGAVVFGSGYVLLAFLRADLVDRAHWLTESQLVDAVAVGQFTPGPVFTTATFIGYVVAGGAGAAAATFGVFLPSFLLVAASGPLIPRLRRSPFAGAFLDGVNAAAVALMAVVAVQLARASIVDVPTLLLTLGAAVVLARWKVNSAWLVLAAGAIGAGLHALRH